MEYKVVIMDSSGQLTAEYVQESYLSCPNVSYYCLPLSGMCGRIVRIEAVMDVTPSNEIGGTQ